MRFFENCFVLLPQMGNEKTPITWTILRIEVVIVLRICSFSLLRNMTKMAKIVTVFVKFSSFLVQVVCKSLFFHDLA